MIDWFHFDWTWLPHLCSEVCKISLMRNAHMRKEAIKTDILKSFYDFS